jgi:penicillin amidase
VGISSEESYLAPLPKPTEGAPAMRRWLIVSVGGFAALVAVSALFAFLTLFSFRNSEPEYEGMVEVAQIDAPVRIVRDEYAIPHIVAESFPDASFGLGYAHAQDRLWQMEMSRRYVQGRLAEMFGETAFDADVQLRTYGVYAAAISSVARLTPETRAILESYAAGVNAFLDNHAGPLPIEFTLAGITPEPWRPADSVAVLKGMAMSLSGNAGSEAERIALLAVLGKNSVEDFISPFSEGPLPDYIDGLFGTTQLGSAYGIANISASNNWVVGGTHSATGKPLVANDPHLGFSIPSTWYLAHLSIPDEDMVGGTLAGVPAIIVGRNRHTAWGVTNTGPDTQDLYVERLDSDNPELYQIPEGWAEFETRTETIAMRFGDEETVRIRASRHGPVLDRGRYADIAPPGHAIALSWTALAPDDTSLDAILAINRAADAEDMREAANFYVAPMQNIVYADDGGEHGRIGLMLPGRVPVRAAANDSLGLVPAPGWDARYDWLGYIPADQLPHLTDPASGRIVTANNKTVPDDYPHMLSRDWDAPYRHDRIEKLLAATLSHDVDSFRQIQLDIVDSYATNLKRRLVAAGPFDDGASEAARLVAAWDGSMLRERPEPLIFAAWARALSQRIYADELGETFEEHSGFNEDFVLRVLDDTAGQSRWCDNRITAESEDCATQIRLALDDALSELSAAYGEDPSAWRWGDAHISVHESRPFGDLPLIGSWFNREIAVDGGAFTVQRADHRLGSRRPYAAVHGAGYRGIYDLANIDASLYIIATGQSGNLFSPHYDDLLELWASGGYVTIPTDRDRIDRQAATTLTLTP